MPLTAIRDYSGRRLTAVATTPPTYFFSYAREDAAFALKLAKQLRQSNANIWLDQLDIVAGQRWDQAVEEALRTCQGMLIVLTPESVASNNVMDEVSYALEEGKLVVPVLYKPCDIPFRLRRLQYVDFTVDDNSQVETLLKALQRERPPAPRASDEQDARAETNVPSTRPERPVPKDSSSGSRPRDAKKDVLVWSAVVALLGLWPMALGPSDDPFLVNPLVIAGGLLALAFVRPIEPQTALAFSVVPYVLNLWGMALVLHGGYLTSFYLTSSEFVVGLVAFAASLFVVRVICKRRVP